MADIAKLSVGREDHYTRDLADSHEQYLSSHGESPSPSRACAPRRWSVPARPARSTVRLCGSGGLHRGCRKGSMIPP